MKRSRHFHVRAGRFEIEWDSMPVSDRPATVCPSCQVELCGACASDVDVEAEALWLLGDDEDV